MNYEMLICVKIPAYAGLRRAGALWIREEIRVYVDIERIITDEQLVD